MDILIIGGSRFIGPRLIDALIANGHAITVFNRGTHKVDYPKEVTHIKGDRDSGFSVEGHFDAVIDTCAYGGEQTERALGELDFDFFVNVGTAASYAKSEVFPLTENSPLGQWPVWGAYNEGKVACERVLEKSGVEYATLRPVYILGANNYVERERFIYGKLKRHERIVLPGNGNAVVQFVFVQDVVRSLALLAEKKIKGAYNCAGDGAITLNGLVHEMAKTVGVTPLVQYNPNTDGAQFNENEFPFANENFFCSNQKLKEHGIAFTPLHKGLKADYEEYYKNVI